MKMHQPHQAAGVFGSRLTENCDRYPPSASGVPGRLCVGVPCRQSTVPGTPVSSKTSSPGCRQRIKFLKSRAAGRAGAGWSGTVRRPEDPRNAVSQAIADQQDRDQHRSLRPVATRIARTLNATTFDGKRQQPRRNPTTSRLRQLGPDPDS